MSINELEDMSSLLEPASGGERRVKRRVHPNSSTGITLWNAANNNSPQDIMNFFVTNLEIRSQAEDAAYAAALNAGHSEEEAEELASVAGDAAITQAFRGLDPTAVIYLRQLTPGGRDWLSGQNLWAVGKYLGYDSPGPFFNALQAIGCTKSVVDEMFYHNLNSCGITAKLMDPETKFCIDFKLQVMAVDEDNQPILDANNKQTHVTQNVDWQRMNPELIKRIRTWNNTGLPYPNIAYVEARPEIQITIIVNANANFSERTGYFVDGVMMESMRGSICPTVDVKPGGSKDYVELNRICKEVKANYLETGESQSETFKRKDEVEFEIEYKSEPNDNEDVELSDSEDEVTHEYTSVKAAIGQLVGKESDKYAFVGAIKSKLIKRYYSNPGLFIARGENMNPNLSEEDTYRGNLVTVKFSRAFTLDDLM